MMIPRFRAWDKNKTEMLDVNCIYWDADGNLKMVNCSIFRDDYEVKQQFDFHAWSKEDSPYNLKNLILMQSTDLQDKNGVEIFEGDIIKYPHKSCDGQEITYRNYEVFWDADSASFMGLVYGYDIPAGLFLHAEIIGNIYKHSHLLKHKP